MWDSKLSILAEEQAYAKNSSGERYAGFICNWDMCFDVRVRYIASITPDTCPRVNKFLSGFHADQCAQRRASI